MKYLFLIIFSLSFQAFSQTDCEKAKRDLARAKTAYKTAEFIVEKNHRIDSNNTIALQSADATWRKALQVWAKADKIDPKANEVWNKADKAYDKAWETWKKSVVASLERTKANPKPLQKPYKELERTRAKVSKVCSESDTLRIKLFAPKVQTAKPIQNTPSSSLSSK